MIIFLLPSKLNVSLHKKELKHFWEYARIKYIVESTKVKRECCHIINSNVVEVTIIIIRPAFKDMKLPLPMTSDNLSRICKWICLICVLTFIYNDYRKHADIMDVKTMNENLSVLIKMRECVALFCFIVTWKIYPLPNRVHTI